MVFSPKEVECGLIADINNKVRVKTRFIDVGNVSLPLYVLPTGLSRWSIEKMAIAAEWPV